MKKLLVVGASGLLGNKVMSAAKGSYDCLGTFHPETDDIDFPDLIPLDICSVEDVQSVMQETNPDQVVLTAAMTNVDGCEVRPDLAMKVNAHGPKNVAESCKMIGARLIHMSTDYVFDGYSSKRYSETAFTKPISVYGSSKLAGEVAVLSTLPEAIVARTAVLYGWTRMNEKDNFVTWVLKKMRNSEKVHLFEDQFISPTLADDLAVAILNLLNMKVRGVWHVSGPDCLNRPECGRMITQTFGFDENLVVPVPSSSIPLPAKRPNFSCLDSSKVEKLLNRKLMPFKQGLETMRAQEEARK